MKPQSERTLNPRSLAQAFDRFVAARWRGEDRAADGFAAWFEAHWTSSGPPEPDDPPEAANVLGGSGGGIRWYAHNNVVRGYVSGRSEGSYGVAVGEAVPVVPAPWEAPAHDDAATDRLLHHAGDPELVAASRGPRSAARSPHRRSPIASDRGLVRPGTPMPRSTGEARDNQPAARTAMAEVLVAERVLESAEAAG